MLYTGIKCPVCGVPFRENDDVVVCPECGAPYHRECYSQEGKCIFDDLHREHRDWEPPAPPAAPDVSAEIKDRECPVCGVLNSHSSLFCNRCGAPLAGEPSAHKNTDTQQKYGSYGRQGGYVPPAEGQHTAPFSPIVPPFTFDPMGGVNPTEPMDRDVTYGEVSKVVRQNTNYYMPVFRYIRLSGKNKFNFSAFLLSGIWMLYRKQYRAGIPVTILQFLLYLCYQLSYYLLAWPAMVAAGAGIGVELNMESFLGLTEDQYMAISQVIAGDPAAVFHLLLPYLFLTASLILMIVVGVCGNRKYLKHCADVVRKVRLDDKGDPAALLTEKGGTNAPVVLCAGVCFVILRTFLPLLLL